MRLQCCTGQLAKTVPSQHSKTSNQAHGEWKQGTWGCSHYPRLPPYSIMSPPHINTPISCSSMAECWWLKPRALASTPDGTTILPFAVSWLYLQTRRNDPDCGFNDCHWSSDHKLTSATSPAWCCFDSPTHVLLSYRSATYNRHVSANSDCA